MNECYMNFTEETNALDYFERSVRFIREASKDNQAWKWVIIALHGALYGFAICACKGTDYHHVTEKTKWGWRLISFADAIAMCEDPSVMNMTTMSRPLILSDDQRAAIKKLQYALRNPFEHFVPLSWHIEIDEMPTIAIHCIEIIRFLSIETGNYTMLTKSQISSIDSLSSETIEFLHSLPKR